MSADNWTVCPRCARDHSAHAEKLRAKADAAYGVVPIDEWMHLNDSADKALKPYEEAKFREDYEIFGAEDGTVEVSYRGSCTACSLSVDFQHSHRIDGLAA